MLEILETLEGFDYDDPSADFWNLGCNGNHDDRVKWTLRHVSAIHLAASNNRQVLKWLPEAERRPREIDQQEAAGVTALIVAAFRGLLENCKLLVSSGADVLKTLTHGGTAFHVACGFGQIQVCNYLLSVNESLASMVCSQGTPLELAVEGGHTDVVRLFLTRDIDVPAHLENDGQKTGNDDIARLLRSHLRSKVPQEAGVDREAEKEVNTLQMLRVCEKGSENDLVCLVRAGVKPNRRLNKGNETALHISNRNGWTEAIQALVHVGAEVDWVDWNAETPLTKAVSGNHLDAVKIILALGASTNFCNLKGRSELHLAVNSYEMTAYLLENGADAPISSYDGVTPLMRATESEVVELLSRHGCDPFVADAGGGSAVLCMSGNSTAGEALGVVLSKRPLRRMLDVIDLRCTSTNSTPLYNAAFCGFVAHVLALIEHGADVNLPGGRHRTPYQAAFKQGHTKVLRLLTEHGAKPCMVVRDGREQAARFWEHGGQFCFPAADGRWVPTSLPLEPRKLPPRITASDARNGRYWEHGYRFCLQDRSGRWMRAEWR